MNILFCAFNENWHNEVIKKIVDELEADEVISISKINHALQVKNENYHWINNSYFINHEYDFFKDKELPAIDAYLLEKMFPYESLYYPMQDRYEINNFVTLSYQQRNRYYKEDLSTLLWVLQYYHIDICIINDMAHIGYDYVLYGLCKSLGIPTLIGYQGILIPHKSATVFVMSDIFDPIPDLRHIQYRAEHSGDKERLSLRMQSYIDQYNRDKSEIVSFLSLSTFVKTNKIKTFLRLVVNRIKEKEFILAVRRKWHRYWDARKVNKYLDAISYTEVEDRYVYYPLHYQPECTSLPMGAEYYDQLLVIKMISRNLPDDVMLYVKPHPYRSLYADKEYYNEISSLRNVKIISKNINTYELIDNAVAVVSLTGTVILEALVRKKNVLMFGYYIWQYAPGVFHCKTESDCINALQEVCSGRGKETDGLVHFLEKLDEHLTDGIITKNALPLYEIDMKKNIENISNSYINFVRKMMDGGSKVE